MRWTASVSTSRRARFWVWSADPAAENPSLPGKASARCASPPARFRHHRARWRRHHRAGAKGTAAAPRQDADDLSRSFRIAEPANDGRPHHRRAAGRASPRQFGGAARAGRLAHEQSRAANRSREPAAARVFRRPAPEHRHRRARSLLSPKFRSFATSLSSCAR